MSIPARSIDNPLALIAVLAATTEASALASLPLLDHRNQGVFVWFLVGFPPFLTLLFFITLNFNRKALGAQAVTPATSDPLPLVTSYSPHEACFSFQASESAAVIDPPLPSAVTTQTTTVPGLHILRYGPEDDWQQLQPQVQAWADSAFAQPRSSGRAAAMLVLPA
jgi:hypothetical protein